MTARQKRTPGFRRRAAVLLFHVILPRKHLLPTAYGNWPTRARNARRRWSGSEPGVSATTGDSGTAYATRHANRIAQSVANRHAELRMVSPNPVLFQRESRGPSASPSCEPLAERRPA